MAHQKEGRRRNRDLRRCRNGVFGVLFLAAPVYEEKILLFQNNTLGLVHQIQKAAPYHGPFGVALDGSPDFAAIAAAYGIPSITVGEEEELPEAIDRFLGSPGSCLMICRVHPDVNTTD